jgi:hypothetical protein
MKNLFNDISQEERKRILEMHENATKRNYLTEQSAPAPAPAPVPTGPTGGVTKKPAVVPGGDKPQGSAGIYKQIDVTTFNKELLNCWFNTTSNGKYRVSASGKYEPTSRDSDNQQNNDRMRNALFAFLNNFYLKSLTVPMSNAELGKLWDRVKTYKITYDFLDLSQPREMGLKPKSSTVGEVIPNIYTDEKQLRTDYVSIFNCALKAIQGS